MAAFEYLSVLISIILALGMTRVLGGVGEMLQARSHRRIYWVHVVWIINLFLYLVIAWWIFYRWRNQQPWTFYLFVFVLISPTILYLALLLLFPRESDVDRPSLQDHYTRSPLFSFRAVSAGRYCRFAAERRPSLSCPGTNILRQRSALFHRSDDCCNHA